MATRASVETKITAINNGGANTAAEVRDVLTELLNYTENLPPTPSVETFRIGSKDPFIGSLDATKLYVSIRGIRNEFATMTLLYKSTINEPVSTIFTIPFNQTAGDFSLDNFEMLVGQSENGIIPLLETGNFLKYYNPSQTDIGAVTAPTNSPSYINVALVRNFQNITNSLVINVRGSSSFETSIAMHSNKFLENLNENTGKPINIKAGVSAKGTTTKSITLEDLFGL